MDTAAVGPPTVVTRYRVTITTKPDGTWSYDSLTTLKFSEHPEPFAHVDKNTLRHVPDTSI